MRIGISCYSTFGGSGVVATEVGKALAARGHETIGIAVTSAETGAGIAELSAELAAVALPANSSYKPAP